MCHPEDFRAANGSLYTDTPLECQLRQFTRNFGIALLPQVGKYVHKVITKKHGDIVQKVATKKRGGGKCQWCQASILGQTGEDCPSCGMVQPNTGTLVNQLLYEVGDRLGYESKRLNTNHKGYKNVVIVSNHRNNRNQALYKEICRWLNIRLVPFDDYPTSLTKDAFLNWRVLKDAKAIEDSNNVRVPHVYWGYLIPVEYTRWDDDSIPEKVWEIESHLKDLGTGIWRVGMATTYGNDGSGTVRSDLRKQLSFNSSSISKASGHVIPYKPNQEARQILRQLFNAHKSKRSFDRVHEEITILSNGTFLLNPEHSHILSSRYYEPDKRCVLLANALKQSTLLTNDLEPLSRKKMPKLDISNNTLLDYYKGNPPTQINIDAFVELTKAIFTMPALKILHMRSNGIKNASAGQALGNAIATNTVLEELDISYQDCEELDDDELDEEHFELDQQFAKAFAKGIRKNTTLKMLTFGGYNWDPQSTPAVLKVDMTEADLSKTCLGVGGAEIVRAWMSCDERRAPLNTLIFGEDKYWDNRQTKFVTTSKQVLNMDMYGAADLSNKNLGAGGAAYVGAWIDQQRLTSLNISSNNIRASGCEHLATALNDTQTITELNLANNNIGQLVLPDGWTVDEYPPQSGRLVYRGPAPAPAPGSHRVGSRDAPAGSRAAGIIALVEGIRNIGTLTSLDISANNIGEFVLAEGWTERRTTTEEEQNVYGRHVFVHTDGKMQTKNPGSKPEGCIAIADAIPTMKALVKLTFGGDGKYRKDDQWVSYTPVTLENSMTEANFQNKNLGAGGAMIVGAWIKHKGKTLSKLDISDNRISSEGAKALAVALKNSNTLTELNVASNWMTHLHNSGTDMSGVIAIIDAIPTMAALTSLDISSNLISILSGENDTIQVTNKLTEAMSNMTAMTDLNISYNSFSAEDMNNIIDIAKHMSTMRTLCEVPFKDTAILELDLSKKYLTGDGAMVVCYYIRDVNTRTLTELNASHNHMFGNRNKSCITAWANALKAHLSITDLNLAANELMSDDVQILANTNAVGRLVKFDVSHNDLHAEGGQAIAEALKNNRVMTNFNISGNCLGISTDENSDMSGVIAISEAISTMKALTSLDISNNAIVGKKGTGVFMMPDFSGVVAFAKAIPTMKALTSLDISKNAIGKLTWSEGWEGWRAGQNETWNFYHSDGRCQNNDPGEPLVPGTPEGAIALANGIKDHQGSLNTLNILNIAGNHIDFNGITQIYSNCTSIKVNIRNNDLTNDQEELIHAKYRDVKRDVNRDVPLGTISPNLVGKIGQFLA